MNTLLHFSSKSDDWETPQHLFNILDDHYGPFTLDVCATQRNTKVNNCYISPEYENSLDVDWEGRRAELKGEVQKCWMNPPYGRTIGLWIKKAYEESLKGCLVVCLLPARTDTKWFHEYCTKGNIKFIRGRLKFGGHKNAAPFPSMIVVFGEIK